MIFNVNICKHGQGCKYSWFLLVFLFDGFYTISDVLLSHVLTTEHYRPALILASDSKKLSWTRSQIVVVCNVSCQSKVQIHFYLTVMVIASWSLQSGE
ncbi:hypothetical protein B5X24_HaOG207114 [Helicoverpa armigera]|uniref:Uncharacterized protein n=1 Tax=Helicoverpa armigera TaxID=29058 RepID=A0A2W1BQ48_HELAM|nr:hypothetical protein B5X24_HaOG207114 [Helicoverpa armigera]